LLTRLLAAVIGLALLLPTLIWGGPLGLQVVVGFAILVCLDEYARMSFPDDYVGAMAWLVPASAAIFFAPLVFGAQALGVAMMLGTLGSFAWVVLRPGTSLEGASDRVGRALLGLAWIPGTLTFLPMLRERESGLLWVALVMVIPWSSDTGGYFAGRLFGRTPLAPRVSPKKTVEGLVGGLALASGALFAVRATLFPSLTVPEVLGMGIGLGIVGVIGDLAESLVKRSFGVKDSGWIMPGHGGLLDRIDALMFIGPLLYAWASIRGAG